MKRRAPLVVALAILAALTLLLPARDEPKLELTLAVPQRVRSTPIYVAIERGYFRDEGIVPVLMVPETGKDALAAVLAGAAHFATVAGLPVVNAARAGRPPSVLAALSYGDLYLGVATAPGSGIRTFHDLRGKRVSVAPGTATEIYLASVMRSYGLRAEDVETVHATPEHAIALLRKGEIDAISTWDQWLTRIATEMGPAVRILRDNDGFFDYWLLVGPPRSGPPGDDELRLMRALAKADAYIRDHPRQAAEIMTRYVGGTHDEWLGTYFDLQLGASVVLALQGQARLANHGDPPASLTTLLRPGPLAAVSPGAAGVLP